MAVQSARAGLIAGVDVILTSAIIQASSVSDDVFADASASGYGSTTGLLFDDVDGPDSSVWDTDPCSPVVADIGLDTSPTGSIIFPYEFDGGSPTSSTSSLPPTTYSYQQFTAATTWIIYHGLNCFPNVAVMDSTGEQVWADVFYDNLNTVRIEFGAALGGSAYLS